MRLHEAAHLAESLRNALEPAAERIAVAGSIRREKPDVKDIEIVAIPSWHHEDAQGVQGGMFDTARPQVAVNDLQRAIEAMAADDVLRIIKPGSAEIEPWHLNADGKYWRLYIHRESIKVDLFLATPDTWGMVYMIRTGSGVGPDGDPQHGFGPAMLARWKAISGGGYSREARLWRPAARAAVEAPEERDVFEACRVRWVEPRERLSSRDVRRNEIP